MRAPTWGWAYRCVAAGAMTAVVAAGLGAGPATAATPGEDAASHLQTALDPFATDPDAGVTSEAREAVQAQVDADGALDDILAAEMDGTLDLSGLDASSSDLDDDVDVAVQDVLDGLPSVDASTGEVTLRTAASDMEFSIAPRGSVRTGDLEGGVTVTSAADGDVAAVSHVTEDLGGQIVGVADSDVTEHVDFEVRVPAGYGLAARSDGAVDLLDASGVAQGRIQAPWAYDETGVALDTHFEIRGDVLRQHFDADAATGKVVVDPAWYWWVGTTALCAVAVAPLVVTGGAALATRVPKLVAFINKIKVNARVAQAVSKIGGVPNATKAIVKKATLELKNKLPSGVRGKMPSVTLNAQEKAFLLVAWPFVVEQVWDLLGFGSCASLWRELRR